MMFAKGDLLDTCQSQIRILINFVIRIPRSCIVVVESFKLKALRIYHGISKYHDKIPQFEHF